jgi:hypothetical protein
MKYFRIMSRVGLTVVAAAVIASGASASAAEYHGTAVGVTVSGGQVTSHQLTLTGSTISCTTVTFDGTITATATTTLQLHPSSSGCNIASAFGGTIDTTGCQYTFHTQTGTFDISGCSNGGLLIEGSNVFGKCVLTISNQTGINGQSWATEGVAPNRDVRWTTNATNIKATVTTSTGICPFTVGSHTNASYTGTTTLKAASGEFWFA